MVGSSASDDDRARRRVAELVSERGERISTLSIALGRNAAYLSQYLHRGTPARLPEDVRLALAMRWNIDERELGARDPWTPARETAQDAQDNRRPSGHG